MGEIPNSHFVQNSRDKVIRNQQKTQQTRAANSAIEAAAEKAVAALRDISDPQEIKEIFARFQEEYSQHAGTADILGREISIEIAKDALEQALIDMTPDEVSTITEKLAYIQDEGEGSTPDLDSSLTPNP